jgi:hypothetical protein
MYTAVGMTTFYPILIVINYWTYKGYRLLENMFTMKSQIKIHLALAYNKRTFGSMYCVVYNHLDSGSVTIVGI